MFGEFNKLMVISLVIIVLIILLIFYLCGIPSMGTLHTTNLIMGIIHLVLAIIMFTGAEKSGWDIFTEREIIEEGDLPGSTTAEKLKTLGNGFMKKKKNSFRKLI